MNSSLYPALKNVKLIHLCFNSRAMIARAALHYRNIPFEDIRIPGEEWKTKKYSGDFEFRNLPKLIVDNREYVQMFAINCYLGRHLDLYGENIEEEYQINSFLNSYEDFAGKGRMMMLLNTDEDRKKAAETFINTHIPHFLTAYEKRFEKYGGKFMVGDKFTLADIYATVYLWNNYRSPQKIKKYGEGILEKYAPKLSSHINVIHDNQLKAFFEKAYIEEEDPKEQMLVAEFMRQI